MKPTLIGATVCASCKFMIVVQVQGQGKPACRRYPPVVTPITMPDPRGWPHDGKGGQGVVHVGEIASFPPVAPDGWCGEYQRKVLVAANVSEAAHMNGPRSSPGNA